MHIKSLQIRNFRAIEYAELKDLPNTVVIAGPNGCGKSCIFDALRLWKSAIGGYNEDEWQHWFNEFQISIDISDPTQLARVFRDRSKSVSICAEIALAKEEVLFIKKNAARLVGSHMQRLQTSTGPRRGPGRRGEVVTVATGSQRSEMDARIQERALAIVSELDGTSILRGTFTISPSLSLQRDSGPALELIYSLYMPEYLGIFEYHSAQRTYQREQISSVDLHLQNTDSQKSRQALYNQNEKYQNIKTQLAGNYIRDMLSERAGVVIPEKESLIGSMKELFRLFFPDKEFVGPQPTQNGSLIFNVKTAAGKEHDINELSSGEKEVLYGYLRLRNLAPRYSTLLLDEPEIHLNPRLIKGLPQFYHLHLGEKLSNQIWLLTHSDTLLKEALDQDGFAIFHMLPASSDVSANQLVPIESGESMDRAILDLVGEVASYRPDGKLLIFEGGGDAEFDLEMTSDLFPELLTKTNMISGTNRNRVRDLHRLLEKANEKGALRMKVFSVVDRDSDSSMGASPSREMMWDCYHIENYLLEPKYILEVLRDVLRHKCAFATEAEVENALQSAAQDVAELVIRSELEGWANSTLVRCLRVGSDPRPEKLVQTLQSSIIESRSRIVSTVNADLALEKIESRVVAARTRVHEELDSKKWMKTLPGREILKRFADRHSAGVGYEKLRNLIIASMKRDGYRPSGMSAVIMQILAA